MVRFSVEVLVTTTEKVKSPPGSGRLGGVASLVTAMVGSRVKVMVPVGPAAGGVGTPPERVAVSLMGWVRVTGPAAWVTIWVGEVPMADVSPGAPQALVTAG